MLGGVPTAVETVRAGLERLGHHVVIVAPRTADQLSDGSHVVRVPALPAPTYPDFSLPLPLGRGFRRTLAALELDIFHAQHPFLLGGTARRLARQCGRPLVFTHHTLYDRYAHYVPLPRALVVRHAIRWSTRFANGADLVIAPSDALAARLRAQGVRRPIEVLPTGIDLGRFHPGDRAAARRLLGLRAEVPLLLYVGRLDREKNLGFLLGAFERIATGHPTARLVLVGRGTEESALRRTAARRGGGDRVDFVGGVAPPDVIRYYQAADAFVFASTTETQGLAAIEAMATGLPVVAVRASGVEEAVLDGVTGLLVPEDAGAFAASVLEVLGDAGLAAKLAASAREGARRFAAPALAERLVALYRRALGQEEWMNRSTPEGGRHDAR